MALAALSPVASQTQPLVFMADEASRFSASEIREAIAHWVAQDRLDLADALVAAGLSLHSDSEDILALGALLAEVNQDWAQAQDHLERLIAVQGEQVSAESLHHYVRVLRCRGAYFNAYLQAQEALKRFPHHEGLRTAHAELTELLESVPLKAQESAQTA